MKDKCTLLIASCDKYSDLWVPFSKLFNKYWPDCPFEAHLRGNIGLDINRSSTLRKQVETIKTPYILLLHEDYFLQSPVDTILVLGCLQALDRLKGNYLRLTPRPKPDKSLIPFIGIIEPRAPYRASLQASIWKRTTLLSLIKDGENAWELEANASRRSDNLNGFYCTWKPVLDYPHDVVVQGKWMRSQAKRYKKMDIGCDFDSRPIMTRREAFKHFYNTNLSRLQHLIPWKWRRWLHERMV